MVTPPTAVAQRRLLEALAALRTAPLPQGRLHLEKSRDPLEALANGIRNYLVSSGPPAPDDRVWCALAQLIDAVLRDTEAEVTGPRPVPTKSLGKERDALTQEAVSRLNSQVEWTARRPGDLLEACIALEAMRLTVVGELPALAALLGCLLEVLKLSAPVEVRRRLARDG